MLLYKEKKNTTEKNKLCNLETIHFKEQHALRQPREVTVMVTQCYLNWPGSCDMHVLSLLLKSWNEEGKKNDVHTVGASEP